MTLAASQIIPQIKMRGLHGEQRLLFFVSEHNLFVYQKCAVLKGFGMDSIVPIVTTKEGKMDLNDLKSKIEEAKATKNLPCMVVGTAGTEVLRAIDPLNKIADICNDNGLWFHVDATVCHIKLMMTLDLHRMFLSIHSSLNLFCSIFKLVGRWTSLFGYLQKGAGWG